jgi:hypothetical protein
MRVVSFFVVVGLLTSCSRPPLMEDGPVLPSGECHRGRPSGQAVSVTFSDLAKNGRAYHGRRVRLRGFLELRFEGTLIYDFQKSCEQFDPGGDPADSIWVNVPPSPRSQQLCGHRPAFIEGVYDADAHGRGYSIGELQDVNLIQSVGPACTNLPP